MLMATIPPRTSCPALSPGHDGGITGPRTHTSACLLAAALLGLSPWECHQQPSRAELKSQRHILTPFPHTPPSPGLDFSPIYLCFPPCHGHCEPRAPPLPQMTAQAFLDEISPHGIILQAASRGVLLKHESERVMPLHRMAVLYSQNNHEFLNWAGRPCMAGPCTPSEPQPACP